MVTHELARLPLRGRGGEPIDLRRTIMSHGVADLPPMAIDESTPSFQVTLRMPGSGARTIVVRPRGRCAAVEVSGRAPGRKATEHLVSTAAHILRFDEDLSTFYERAAADPDLDWVTSGAGRMIRSASVFEEVVKTVCTTNCAWGATVRMVSGLVEHLGEKAPGAPPAGPAGRSFPSPEAMAAADDDFYRNVIRAGYRGPYLRAIARSVADDELDLEEWGSTPASGLPDDELEQRLLALPGVGPYAAAHIMMMLGRYSRLILDSWTRPKYARLTGRKSVTDSTIVRRFKPYREYAGLAFWLFLTRDWVEEP